MSSLIIYGLTTSNQPDLFLSDSTGSLNLEKLRCLMIRKSLPISEGKIVGEGFGNVYINQYHGYPQFIECITTTENSLGYYYPAEVDDDSVVSQKVHHTYFSKSNVLITGNSFVVIKFEWAAEESSKSRVKALLESLGLKVVTFKVTDKLIRNIQEKYTWTAAKIEKIEKDGDKTKKVSYEIDPTDSNESRVDQEYRNHGKMSHVTFEHPFPFEDKHPSTRPYISVKLYNEGGNRIFFNNEEFGDNEDIRRFQLLLLQTLNENSV